MEAQESGRSPTHHWNNNKKIKIGHTAEDKRKNLTLSASPIPQDNSG